MKRDKRLDNRGRTPKKTPSERDLHILNALKEDYSQAEIGRVYGMSRQYVYQIKKRWPQFGVEKKPVLKNRLKK